MDPDDLDLARDEYEEGYYRRKNGALECHCCRPRKWTAAEAFSDTGFDEGRRVMTVELAEAMGRHGYDVEYEWQDCYNRVILSIKFGDRVIYDRETAQGTPEERFAALPMLARTACQMAVFKDLEALGETHVVPAEDLALALGDVVDAMMPLAERLLAYKRAGGDINGALPAEFATE
jgi:hypothetical protein